METIVLHDKKFRLYIPYEKIVEAIGTVAEKLKKDYADANPLFVSVLNGSFMFTAELMQRLDFPVELSFVKLSSYAGTSSQGRVVELLGLNRDVRGRKVIILEDIVETGLTISGVYNQLKASGAESVEVCTLFFKPDAYKGCIPVRYYAMTSANDFIVGFGLDYKEAGRQYKDIYILDV